MAFTVKEFRAFMSNCSALMEENKQYLIDLDSALGDGDLGLTMTAGFKEAVDFSAQAAETDVGMLAAKTGMAVSRKVPSTMGTLVASGLMGAGKAAKGKTELNDKELASFVSAFAEGVMHRGKAQRGDRTIIDALVPGAEAFQVAIDGGQSVSEAAKKADEAAAAGRDATKDMKPKFGRAVYYGDQVLGKVDQGAVVGSLIFKALHQTLA